jgi:hypothetical protein
VSDDVSRSSQRAAFWSTNTVPLSAGTRRGRRGFFQIAGEPISRDQTLIITQVWEGTYLGLPRTRCLGCPPSCRRRRL